LLGAANNLLLCDARSRRKPQPLRLKPVTVGDLIRDGKLLEVHCSSCRPARHLYIDASLDLPKQMPVPEVANHLVCSVCGAKNSDTYHPIWARPDARVAGVTGRYPDFDKRLRWPRLGYITRKHERRSSDLLTGFPYRRSLCCTDQRRGSQWWKHRHPLTALL